MDYVDTPTVQRRRFDAIWDRALSSGLRKYLLRNANGDGDTCVKAAGEALWACHHLLFPLFDFYASLGGFCGVIGLNSFSQFVEDCRVSDAKSEYCRRSDLDRLVCDR